MYSAEGIGKTIEKAIENALLELKAPREDVDIKILSEGGLFKKAKVVVSISEDALPRYQKRDEKRKEEKIVEEKKEEIKVETEKDIEKQEKKEEKDEEKKVKKETKQKEKEEKKEQVKEEIESKEIKHKEIDPLEFLKGFFETAGKTVEIQVKEDEKYITYIVIGEDLGELIGHRGESFYAISRLVNAICHSEKKILLDIGGFREKRVESLTELAYRIANKVAKSGRYYKLDPMNPSDRRIIHTALQDDDRVTTLSKGSEPNRQVIISKRSGSNQIVKNWLILKEFF